MKVRGEYLEMRSVIGQLDELPSIKANNITL